MDAPASDPLAPLAVESGRMPAAVADGRLTALEASLEALHVKVDAIGKVAVELAAVVNNLSPLAEQLAAGKAGALLRVLTGRG